MKIHWQATGINTIKKLPQKIAQTLKLKGDHLYTGHSFRRTAATMLTEGGASLLQLKQFRRWKSDTVAQKYIDSSVDLKTTISSKLVGTKRKEPEDPEILSNSKKTQLEVKDIKSVDFPTPSEMIGQIFGNCTLSIGTMQMTVFYGSDHTTNK